MLTIPLLQETVLDDGKVALSRQHGFTLIETMVVVAIIAILASLAAPSFLGLIAGTNVTSTVNSFVSDTRFARGEAMRRGKSVTICRSSAPSAAVPSCSTGDGIAVGAWKEGWVVFEDLDGDGAFDAGERVLRIQESFPNISDMLAVGASPSVSAVNNRNGLTYDATGRAVGQASRWLVHASGGFSADDRYTRTLCMNSVGRVRVLEGVTACS